MNSLSDYIEHTYFAIGPGQSSQNVCFGFCTDSRSRCLVFEQGKLQPVDADVHVSFRKGLQSDLHESKTDDCDGTVRSAREGNRLLRHCPICTRVKQTTVTALSDLHESETDDCGGTVRKSVYQFSAQLPVTASLWAISITIITITDNSQKAPFLESAILRKRHSLTRTELIALYKQPDKNHRRQCTHI